MTFGYSKQITEWHERVENHYQEFVKDNEETTKGPESAAKNAYQLILLTFITVIYGSSILFMLSGCCYRSNWKRRDEGPNRRARARAARCTGREMIRCTNVNLWMVTVMIPVLYIIATIFEI